MKYDWEKALDRLPYVKLLGINILEAENGHAIGYIDAEKKHENQMQGMHGGCLFSLADTIAGACCLTTGIIGTTVDSNMSFLKAPPCDRRIFCEANTVKKGRNISVYDTKIYDESGTVYAVGRFSYYMLDLKFEGFEIED